MRPEVAIGDILDRSPAPKKSWWPWPTTSHPNDHRVAEEATQRAVAHAPLMGVQWSYSMTPATAEEDESVGTSQKPLDTVPILNLSRNNKNLQKNTRIRVRTRYAPNWNRIWHNEWQYIPIRTDQYLWVPVPSSLTQTNMTAAPGSSVRTWTKLYMILGIVPWHGPSGLDFLMILLSTDAEVSWNMSHQPIVDSMNSMERIILIYKTQFTIYIYIYT